MVETNIRIVLPGEGLAVPSRLAVVTGTALSPDLMEKACFRLRQNHGLAAMPLEDRASTLLVATDQPIPTTRLQDDDWEMTVKDGGGAYLLTLDTPGGREWLPCLVERALPSES